MRCQTALRLEIFLGCLSSCLLSLFLFPSSVSEGGVDLFSLLTASSLFFEKLIDLLGMGALAGPLNDPDKAASLLSM